MAADTDPAEGHPEAAPDPRALGHIVSRFLPHGERRRLEAAARGGGLRRVALVELLRPEELPRLAWISLWLLLGSGVSFLALDFAARRAQGAGPFAAPLLVLAAANLVAYILMIVVHELLHAVVILGLGGRPRFGLKLPLAAYCTAPGQLFTRGGYAAIALTPLVALTLAGAVVTWLLPDAGALLWLAFVGNVAGAAGDLVAVAGLRRLPRGSLIADTETGFVAYAEVSRP